MSAEKTQIGAKPVAAKAALKTAAKTPKTAPKNRSAEISLARRAAFNILLAVERGHSHSDDLLRGKAVNVLALADRNLATALVLGVLRWQIPLDRAILALLARPNARLDPEIKIALRLGAFQLLHMDRIPARAAIDESVELAKQAGHRFASAMVNAVLRKLAGAAQAGPASEAFPAWMVERWVSFYSMEATQAICRHSQIQPVLAVRLASQAIEAEVALGGVVLEPGELLTAARAVVCGDVSATAAFRQGRLRFQDEGSQLVAELACAHLSPSATKFLDACAAPGGKTLILAERHLRARIVACESSAPRFAQLRKRLGSLDERVECRQADATALTEEAAFDLVLADVPCSGTGTLGRNPEIRHRLRLEDLTRQAERQRAILAAALRAVRPGGCVIYSTCSLEPEENQQVVAAVLAAHPMCCLVSLAPRIGKLSVEGIVTPQGAELLGSSLTPEGCLRLLPGRFKTDGFFIALLERVS